MTPDPHIAIVRWAGPPSRPGDYTAAVDVACAVPRDRVDRFDIAAIALGRPHVDHARRRVAGRLQHRRSVHGAVRPKSRDEISTGRHGQLLVEWQAERASDWRKPPADHVTTRYQEKRLGDCAPVFLDFVFGG